MVEDARFEDATDKPLNLKALDTDDLQVIATLSQDAVFPAAEMSWRPSERRFALLINRFRWEDQAAAEVGKRAYERVQAVLAFDSVLKVQSQGIQRGDEDTILSLLSIAFIPGDDGAGRIELTLAGDGAIALSVECIDATLKDVTRPYIAPSRAAPKHPE
ncbi:MAG: DUF2948 family protein [Pseudoruegeria sp.]